jgi:hypothetical protein
MIDLSKRPPWEVADVLRSHSSEYLALHNVSPEQALVLRRLMACRTAALGGHRDSCSGCGFARISYNSCRDRHCPKCQAGKRAQWLDQRLARLLPVPYFHVVFTLPDTLNPLILHNARQLYGLLFEAASATLLTLGADPKRLGAQIGVTAILHTWGQNLLFHPHLHCVVTGGGLSRDGQRWIPGRSRYFLPVKVLGQLFRGKFLAALKDLYCSGKLSLTGNIFPLQNGKTFQKLLDVCYRRPWIVYAKRPFGSVEQVFRYLGRYTHRVAISNSRITELAEGQVTFTWKDYADEQRRKNMTLKAEEFIRRFLMHVLPKGFVRIRHYGLLASINVKSKLARCRDLLRIPSPSKPVLSLNWADQILAWFGFHPLRCPHCSQELKRMPLTPSEKTQVGTSCCPVPQYQNRLNRGFNSS